MDLFYCVTKTAVGLDALSSLKIHKITATSLIRVLKIMATGMVATYLRGNNLSCLSAEDSIVSESSAFDFLLVRQFISNFISRLKMSYFDPQKSLFHRSDLVHCI